MNLKWKTEPVLVVLLNYLVDTLLQICLPAPVFPASVYTQTYIYMIW